MGRGTSPTQYLGVLAKTPPNLIFAQRAPVDGTDHAYNPGDLWVDQDGLAVYQFAGVTGALWIALGTGATGGVVTLTGDSGGPISPVAGNIDLLGTADQIVTTGTTETITFSLAEDIVAPGSLTATTFLEATTDITAGDNITATAGDIEATAGALIAGTTITAGTGITATTGNILATAGAITAGTTLTATLGDITATNGNIVRGTAGNKDVYSSVASTTTAGANSAGTVTLAGGTATVATTAVTAASQIRLYRQGVGSTGAAALGMLTLGTKTAGVSFVINAVQAADATALQASDVSVIGWEIVN